MRKIKGVLFDKDGVLVDFSKTWDPALVSMANDLSKGSQILKSQLLSGVGYDEQQGKALAGSIWGEGHTEDLVQVWNSLLTDLTKEDLVDYINAACFQTKGIALYGREVLQDLFKDLKTQGLFLGIATNDSEASAKKMMASFGLTDNLSLILGYDSVANPKPAPDPLLAFCQHCQIVASEVLVVGDNSHDMQMASSAGAGYSVGVLTGNSSRHDLEHLADHIIEGVVDLPALLTSLEAGCS